MRRGPIVKGRYVAVDTDVGKFPLPPLLSIIFAGGNVTRFGYPKALAPVFGAPLLDHLCSITRSATSWHTAVSTGPVVADQPTEYDEKRDQVRAHTYENLKASVIYDKSKAHCLKNIAKVVNGQFEIAPQNLSVEGDSADIEIYTFADKKPPIINVGTDDSSFLWQVHIGDIETNYELWHDLSRGYWDKSRHSMVFPPSKKCTIARQRSLEEIIHKSSVLSWHSLGHRLRVAAGVCSNIDAWRLRFPASDLRNYLTKYKEGPIAVLNGDVVVLNDYMSTKGSGGELMPTFRALLSAHRAIKSGCSGYAGLFRLLVPKTPGREYVLDSDGFVSDISEKDRKGVTQEGVIFAFSPKDLLEADIPNIETAGTSDVCSALIRSGKKVRGERFDNVCVDLNDQKDYEALLGLVTFEKNYDNLLNNLLNRLDEVLR